MIDALQYDVYIIVLMDFVVVGTAKVDCLAQTSNTTAVDYTDRVAKALRISFVA
jgi:hypothetical protein